MPTPAPPAWWKPWATVQLRPVAGLVTATSGGVTLAVRPGREARVLDEAQRQCCTVPGSGVTLGVLVDELFAEGLLSGEEAFGTVAHVVTSLQVAELVTLTPSPTGIIPAPPPSTATRPVLPRRVAHSAHLAGRVPELANRPFRHPFPAEEAAGSAAGGLVPRIWRADVADAVQAVIGAERPGTVCLVGVWVRMERGVAEVVLSSRDGTPSPDARWYGPVWIDVDAAEVHVVDRVAVADRLDRGGVGALTEEAVRSLPLGSVEVPTATPDTAALAATAVDLFVPHPASSTAPATDQRLRLALHLAHTGRLVGRPGTGPTPPPEVPPSPVDGLGAIGVLGAQTSSVKVLPGRVVTGRSAWPFRLAGDPADLDSTAITRGLTAFALPRSVAERISTLPGFTGRFVVGIEPGSGPGGPLRKCYLEIEALETWEALLADFPELGDLHRASLLSPDHEPSVPPRYVTWKVTGDGRPQPSIYRRDHAPGTTVGTAIDRLLRDHPDWAAVGGVFVGLIRSLDDPLGPGDLEVVDAAGRHSVDVTVDEPAGDGALLAAAQWLSAVAALDPPAARTWEDVVTRRAVRRVVVGVDATSRPFLSTYHDDSTDPVAVSGAVADRSTRRTPVMDGSSPEPPGVGPPLVFDRPGHDRIVVRSGVTVHFEVIGGGGAGGNWGGGRGGPGRRLRGVIPARARDWELEIWCGGGGGVDPTLPGDAPALGGTGGTGRVPGGHGGWGSGNAAGGGGGGGGASAIRSVDGGVDVVAAGGGGGGGGVAGADGRGAPGNAPHADPTGGSVPPPDLAGTPDSGGTGGYGVTRRTRRGGGGGGGGGGSTGGDGGVGGVGGQGGDGGTEGTSTAGGVVAVELEREPSGDGPVQAGDGGRGGSDPGDDGDDVPGPVGEPGRDGLIRLHFGSSNPP